MDTRQQLEHEITAIVLAAVAGENSQQELQKLNDLIAEQPELVEFVVDLMSQESWLSWHSARARNGSIRPELRERISQIGQAELGMLGSSETPESLAPGRCDVTSHLVDRELVGYPARNKIVTFIARGSRYAAALAAILLVAVGVVLGNYVARWQHPFPTNMDGVHIADSESATPGSCYVARFVQGTACLWNQETNPPLNSNHTLRTGESLSLLEGLAEFQLDWDTGGAALRIEGPAGLVLTAERGASLSHGRFTADVKAGNGRFFLSTPNGLIQVTGNASLGVSVSGGNVEVHLFKGDAHLIVPWTRGFDWEDPLEVTEGNSIRIVSETDGRIHLERGSSSPSGFASKVSMGSDNLRITPEFVREIVAAEPLVYWRFEDADPRHIANEMGDEYHATVVGAIDRVKDSGNTSLELGAGLADEALQSYLICDEPLRGDFSGGYSVEFWLKPSHYHWASLVAMLGEPEQPGWSPPHGFLLEIGGPRSAASEIEHPGRIRYLHRNPPGADFASGTSCFSDVVYDLRRWQHVVAVKNNTHLRLYVNGELVADGKDSTTLAPELRILVGQLDQEQFYRRFVGQIDELAFYARPLSEQEILRHYRLVRPVWNKIDRPRESDRTAEFRVVPMLERL